VYNFDNKTRKSNESRRTVARGGAAGARAPLWPPSPVVCAPSPILTHDLGGFNIDICVP